MRFVQREVGLALRADGSKDNRQFKPTRRVDVQCELLCAGEPFRPRGALRAFRMRLPLESPRVPAASSSCNMNTALERIRGGCLCNEETSVLQAVLPSAQGEYSEIGRAHV